MRILRLTIVFLLVNVLGSAIALGIAWLVSLWIKWLAGWVFVLVMIYWLWTGWKYATALDRGRTSKTKD